MSDHSTLIDDMSHDRDRGYVISLYIYIYTNIYVLQCVAVCCSVLG